MSDAPKRTFRDDFKRFFLRGLVVLLPTVLTLWLVVKAYQFVDSTIAEPVNQSIRLAMGVLTPKVEALSRSFEPSEDDVSTEVLDRIQASRGREEPDREEVRGELRAERINAWWGRRWYMDLIGLFVAILGTYMIGKLLGGFFGRRVYARVERLITSLPIFKQVYPHVKQVVDFLFSGEKQLQFSRVVMVQYPRKGIWSIGFVTGEPMRAIAEQHGDVITIFIPSSPTPFTGYTITVPRTDTIEVPISVDEALKFTISGGVLVPDAQRSVLLGASADTTSAGASTASALPSGDASGSDMPPGDAKDASPRTAVPLQEDNQES